MSSRLDRLYEKHIAKPEATLALGKTLTADIAASYQLNVLTDSLEKALNFFSLLDLAPELEFVELDEETALERYRFFEVQGFGPRSMPSGAALEKLKERILPCFCAQLPLKGGILSFEVARDATQFNIADGIRLVLVGGDDFHFEELFHLTRWGSLRTTNNAAIIPHSETDRRELPLLLEQHLKWRNVQPSPTMAALFSRLEEERRERALRERQQAVRAQEEQECLQLKKLLPKTAKILGLEERDFILARVDSGSEYLAGGYKASVLLDEGVSLVVRPYGPEALCCLLAVEGQADQELLWIGRDPKKIRLHRPRGERTRRWGDRENYSESKQLKPEEARRIYLEAAKEARDHLLGLDGRPELDALGDGFEYAAASSDLSVGSLEL